MSIWYVEPEACNQTMSAVSRRYGNSPLLDGNFNLLQGVEYFHVQTLVPELAVGAWRLRGIACAIRCVGATRAPTVGRPCGILRLWPRTGCGHGERTGRPAKSFSHDSARHASSIRFGYWRMAVGFHLTTDVPRAGDRGPNRRIAIEPPVRRLTNPFPSPF